MQKCKDIKGVIPYDVAGSKASELLDYWMASYTDSICLEIPGNLFYSKSYDDLYTVYSPMLEPVMLEMAKKMKEWGDAGYWRNDVLNYTGEYSGSTFIWANRCRCASHSDIFRIKSEMDEKQPGSDLQMFLSISERK